MQAAAVQLGKVETLIGIGQYESARLQLRQGPASTIRLELRKFEQDTWPGDPQVTAAVVRGAWQHNHTLVISKHLADALSAFLSSCAPLLASDFHSPA